jgi:hypothetical protein
VKIEKPEEKKKFIRVAIEESSDEEEEVQEKPSGDEPSIKDEITGEVEKTVEEKEEPKPEKEESKKIKIEEVEEEIVKEPEVPKEDPLLKVELNTLDKIFVSVEKIKSRAAELHKKGNFDKAVACYTEALDTID